MKAKKLGKFLKYFVIILPVIIAGLFVLNGSDTVCAFKVDNECIDLEVADSPSELIRGLSGRSSLAPNGGMLFKFGKSDRHCMWMKDTSFSLDMIFLDEERKIINIHKNVPPDSFPSAFCSNGLSYYAIEVNAGVADRAGLKTGQTLKL